jgi:cell wall assembly regulator SMI1
MATKDLVQLWGELEKALKKNDPDVKKALRKGATAKALAAAEKALGFSLPPSVHESWAIHDGQKEDGDGAIESPYYLLSLERMAGERDAMTEVYAGLDKTWDPRWLPFLSDLGGNIAYLDFSGKKAGAVVYWDRDGHEHRNGPGSLEEWLGDTLEGLLEEQREYAAISRPRKNVAEEVEAKRLLDRAETARRGGDREAALRDLDRVIALVPELREAWFRRAELKDDTGDQEGALEDLAKGDTLPLTWSERAPIDRVEAAERVIRIKQHLGDLDGALAAIEAFPKRFKNHRWWVKRPRVEVLLARGDHAGASKALDTAWPKIPGHWDSIDQKDRLWRARTLKKLGRLVDAVADYAQVETITKEIICERGLVRAEGGEVAGALEDLERYVQLCVPIVAPRVPVPDPPELAEAKVKLAELRARR